MPDVQTKRQPPQTAYDTSQLVSDENTRHAYLLSLNERISSMPTSFDTNARLEDVLRCVKDAATMQNCWNYNLPPPPPPPPPHTDATPKTHW